MNGLPGAADGQPQRRQPAAAGPGAAQRCGSNHGYTAEQQAVDQGRIDQFVEETGNHARRLRPDARRWTTSTATPSPRCGTTRSTSRMSDNSFGTTYGPSTAGALNLVSGQTHGADPTPTDRRASSDGTMIGDTEPAFDDCPRAARVGRDDRQEHRRPAQRPAASPGAGSGRLPADRGDRTAPPVCDATRPTATASRGVTTTPAPRAVPVLRVDGEPAPPAADLGRRDRHAPIRPTTSTTSSDFWAAARRRQPAGGLLPQGGRRTRTATRRTPTRSTSRLPRRRSINGIQQLPDWPDTAVIIAYDDSDGWYDHVMPPIVNASRRPPTRSPAPACAAARRRRSAGYQDRCGYGPRLPLLVISP